MMEKFIQSLSMGMDFLDWNSGMSLPALYGYLLTQTGNPLGSEADFNNIAYELFQCGCTELVVQDRSHHFRIDKGACSTLG